MSVQATFAATLVDEWAHHGVTDAVICPGSRSTPLALALADRLQVHVRLDERSAGFYAVGLAGATGRPVVICTTSGTAAAELHAAVVESHYGCVPLIVCTADRPPELHGVGASQTIDQSGLFTTSTRWANEPGVPEASQSETWRPLAARSVAEALYGSQGPGPVHLNLAFREPLIGEPGPLPGHTEPALARPAPAAPTPHLWAPLSGRGLLIAGACPGLEPLHLMDFADQLGWPAMADPLSGCRVPGTIAAADALVRTNIERPDTIVLFGTPWLSKALSEYVVTASGEGARILRVDPWGRRIDPTGVVNELHHAPSSAFMRGALEHAQPAPAQWLTTWRDREDAAQKAIDSVLGDQLTEPQVARRVWLRAGAAGAAVFVSASMPMRDLEWFAPTLAEPPKTMANRGVNGIDGVVSSALGVAASGRRTFALLGDLAFLHDVSGLVNLRDDPCTFVVVDNGGGGIFSFLPQADALASEQFEMLFGTPPTTDVSRVADGFGLPVTDVATVAELNGALLQDPPAMVRVRVPGRAENVTLHNALNQAVRLAIA
ncbi:MAG TPA: 2-succinyl-5-enolpyruvyl-6-hydroxy-3-cyclohexene-1-carboxylic-acid synthase [Acidimicrobiales bacterium]|nr:2-succinyl-5-enolpyruvyl-6-hydroxy-3-cyclohexene-1-carboxylic-acid synthase [Acidimicrobiales bacterium]